jgi:hypothetical protein
LVLSKTTSKRPQSFDATIRNLFRQHFNRANTHLSTIAHGRNTTYWKEIQKARRLTPRADLEKLYHIVEENPYYPFPGMGTTFPFDSKQVVDSRLRHLTPLVLEREVEIQIARLNHHSKALISALESISNINDAIRSENWDASEKAISEHKVLFGSSMVILKKEFLSTLGLASLGGLSKRYRELSRPYTGSAYALMCRYIYDFADPAFDPTRASRYWINICIERSDQSWWVRVIESGLFLCPITKMHLADYLLRNNAVSLIDMLFCLWKANNVRPEWSELSRGWQSLDKNLVDLLNLKFDTFKSKIPSVYIKASSNITDKEVYRLAFMFDEYRNVAEWLSEIQVHSHSEILELLGFDFSWIKNRRLSNLVEDFRANFESTLLDIKSSNAIRIPFLSDEIQLDNFEFLFSLVVGGLLKSHNSELSDDALITLLSRSIDLQHAISSKTIEALKTTKVFMNSALLRFMISEVQYRKFRTGDNELERRLSFMEIFPSQDKAEILIFLENVAQRNSSLALQLAQLCTRRFLEKLFLLMSSVKDVLEVRIEICNWLTKNDKRDTGDFKEERDALSRELENLDARSDVDSTRVHVDEDSLREWFVDVNQASVSRYVQTVLAEGETANNESMLTYFNRSKKEGDVLESSTIGSDIILLEIFEQTLRAFSSDKSFGLDSYLSRRIRHGTLRGHLITPLDRAIRRFEDAKGENLSPGEQANLSKVHDRIISWRNSFLDKIDNVRRNVIQIKSEKTPHGLIQATWKIIANIAHLDAMVGRVRSRVVESAGMYDIFPDIYALCWDCIEPDLAQLRLFMAKEFLSDAQQGMRQTFDQLPYECQQFSRDIFLEMEEILAARVREICGWFIRPVFRRDSYSLRTLISTVFSTTRDLDENFKFTEHVSMISDITISRGSFEVFWDALFVLVGNAGRHGQKNGRIEVSAYLNEADEQLVEISVSSELNPDTAIADIERIRTAFSVSQTSDLDKAAVEEGFSGLRKLMGLLHRIRYPGVGMRADYDVDQTTITFHARLPSVILFRRSRG